MADRLHALCQVGDVRLDEPVDLLIVRRRSGRLVDPLGELFELAFEIGDEVRRHRRLGLRVGRPMMQVGDPILHGLQAVAGPPLADLDVLDDVAERAFESLVAAVLGRRRAAASHPRHLFGERDQAVVDRGQRLDRVPLVRVDARRDVVDSRWIFIVGVAADGRVLVLRAEASDLVAQTVELVLDGLLGL